MDEVDVIRPTRNGGHTIIFTTEEARDKAHKAFKLNEQEAEIEVGSSNITAPKKKYAKVVCRDPPDDVTMENVLQDLFSKNNIHLHQVPMQHREARIINTRFGWIFEISSVEAAAIQAQGGRIRYGHVREMKVEEYISLQQCYKCCAFGQNTKDCRSSESYCRLCGEVGHAGWDWPHKDNRDEWKCTNCITNNLVKGMNLPKSHTAAQLHKCPYAQNQREMRKAQLAAAGIFTSPVFRIMLNNQMSGSINNSGTSLSNGAQNAKNDNNMHNNKSTKKSRSRSIKGNIRTTHNQVNSTMQKTSGSSSSSATASSLHETQTIKSNLEAYKNKAIRIQRPKSTEGWRIVGPRAEIRDVEIRGRDSVHTHEGINNTTNLPLLNADAHNSPMSPG